MEERTAVKRRGILAAAAVGAAIVSTKTSQSVGATTGGTNGNSLAIGANDATGTANTYTETTTLRPTTATNGLPAYSIYHNSAMSFHGRDDDEGIEAYCNGSTGYGVYDASDAGKGVVGVVESTSPGSATGYGVYGQCGNNFVIGTYGLSLGGNVGSQINSAGVYGVGQNASGYGVVGQVSPSSRAAV